MALTIFSIFTAVVLCLNALAILSESRFLVKIGLGSNQVGGGGGVPSAVPYSEAGFSPASPFDNPDAAIPSVSQGSAGSTVRIQMATLLASIRMLLRWPLIFVNSILIVFAIVAG